MTILTREQVDFYDDNGYLIVRQLVDLQMVEEIREALMAVQEGKREGMRRRLEKDFSDGRLSKVERLWDIDHLWALPADLQSWRGRRGADAHLRGQALL
jgi:ectoine hydroxylase-related dioxygenase (phytanoyl-CoA dioxygenase family)